MPRWRDYDDYFPPSVPIAARGGIRAQSKRGAGFGESWWAKRWIAVLEGFGLGTRMQRGRRYARAGQVLSIDVEKGRVSASVQGSRPTPYAIRIAVRLLPEAVWSKVAASVAGQAIFASKLLSGEMPNEIEDAFRACGAALFPESYRDLRTNCSCPDSADPCKHIAAVYYLLGEEFDRDPFLIFRLRGMEREEFLALLGERSVPQRATVPALPPEPLPTDHDAFWAAGALPEDAGASAPVQRPGAAIAKRLGKFPFWRGEGVLLDFLDRVYIETAAKAEETLTRIRYEPKDG
jgi:uncharacterized Zn finger protein